MTSTRKIVLLKIYQDEELPAPTSLEQRLTFPLVEHLEIATSQLAVELLLFEQYESARGLNRFYIV